MEQERRNLLSRLQSIPENKLTKEVIIPLLEVLGYEKVEFFGGPSESGKDILCWEVDKMEDIKLTVIQVKHFPFSNKAADSKSLQTVVNQLTACFKKPLLYTDKTIHLPSEVCLISTHEIETRSLETRFGQYPDLRDQKIKLIDGIKLTSLLIKYNPQLVTKLLGLNFEISTIQKDTLTNEMLLKALGYIQKKEIKSIFTNIDFSLGKLTTHLFFNGTFNPKTETLSLDLDEWSEFKAMYSKILKVFSVSFVEQPLDQIEQEYENLRKQHLADLKRINDRINADFDKKLQDRINAEYKNKSYNATSNKVNSNYKNRIDEIKYEMETQKASKLRSSESSLGIVYKPTLKGRQLAEYLLSKRIWIEERVNEINRQQLIPENLKYFIEQCKEIIETASMIFSCPKFFSCIGQEREIVVRKSFESTRFKLPIQAVFETGLNIIVLGEAGAGKTTSLQIYALDEQKNATRLVLFISLTTLIQQVHKKYPAIFDPAKPSQLDDLIALYLELKGLSISADNFRKELLSKNFLLLLDGIDEVIKSTPWLPEAIAQISQKYEKTVQIVVSSRMSGVFLNKIPFFAVTILPFTNEQRNTFIDKWFNNENYDIVSRIKRHLERHKAISEIVRNPLLTTTLCVLAKNEVPLPNTEIKLYSERMRLLTGHYDLARNIKMRIESSPQVLEIMAQKLAFYLHSEGQKEIIKEDLEKQAKRLFSNIYSIKEIETAVEELIDPCNILVPMTDDGKYGLGHLRYQEFLVAREISTNRAIEIYDLLNNLWWHDSLLLFSQMNSSLYWLIDNLGKNGKIPFVQTILKEMIYARPKHDHKSHYDRLNIYLGLDRVRDERFEGIDNHNLE